MITATLRKPSLPRIAGWLLALVCLAMACAAPRNSRPETPRPPTLTAMPTVEVTAWPTSTPMPTATVEITPTPTATPAPTVTATPAMPPGALGYLVFLSADKYFDIYMVDARCTRAPLGCEEGWIRLTNVYNPTSGKEPPYIDVSSLTASPDGKKIAFVCRTEKATPAEGELGNYDIYVLDVDACRQSSGGCTPEQFTRLTTDSYRDLEPAWSPDGNLIAFVSERGSRWWPDARGGAVLFTMRPDGSAQQPLLDEEALGFPTSMHDPAWSPDSKTLIFVATNPQIAQYFIYAVNHDASNLRPLTKAVPTPVGAKAPPKELISWVTYGRPRWSPDGRSIMYWARMSDATGYFMMDADGSNPRPSPVSSGSWSPDGRQLVYTAAQESDGINSLFVVNADGSDPLRLTSKRHIYGPIWVR